MAGGARVLEDMGISQRFRRSRNGYRLDPLRSNPRFPALESRLDFPASRPGCKEVRVHGQAYGRREFLKMVTDGRLARRHREMVKVFIAHQLKR